jgi:hypothetical protein
LKRHTGKRLAIVNGFVVVTSIAVLVLLAALSFEDGRFEPDLAANLLYVPLLLLLAVVGGLIVSRHPGNLIGVGMCILASAGSLLSVAEAYVEYDLLVDPGSLPAVDLVAWAGNWLGLWVILTPITVLFLLVPEGHLPSPRWRWVLLFDVSVLVLLTVVQMFLSGPMEEYSESINNPLGIDAIEPILQALEFIGFILLLPAIGLSGAGLVVRFRRSEGRERLQLKWLVAAAAAALLIFLASWVIGFFGPDVWGYSTLLAMSLLPIAIGIAILRHNLYGIDRIINRTLVYVPLTAILAGLFVAMTGLIRTIFTDLTHAGSDAAIAISTLAVVAGLTPVKNQLQAFVDRHFREQHDPEKALRALVDEGRRIARVMDRDTYIDSVLEETLSAYELSGASVELTSSNGTHPRTAGHVGEGSPLSIPLVYRTAPVGTLTLWTRQEKEVDEDRLLKSLEGVADALALVVAVAPGRSPAPGGYQESPLPDVANEGSEDATSVAPAASRSESPSP